MVKLPSSRFVGQLLILFTRGILTAVVVICAVIAISSITAIPSYVSNIHKAKEAVLREDCHVVRSAIDSYTDDMHKAPKSLDDVIQAGYLKALPKDFSLESCK